MIQFHNLQLSFPTGLVFSQLTFSVEEGVHTCIAGPSGSGKSSILKILQGYLIPDHGEVWVDGLVLNKKNIREIRSKMAYVPQNVNLPVANGDELIRMLGCPVDRAYTQQLINELGLPFDMLTREFDAMSGGQKQRVVIAICLSLGRKILLLDEPTASLDDEAICKLIDLIAGLKNITVISASHNQDWKEHANRNIDLPQQSIKL